MTPPLTAPCTGNKHCPPTPPPGASAPGDRGSLSASDGGGSPGTAGAHRGRQLCCPPGKCAAASTGGAAGTGGEGAAGGGGRG